MGLVLWSVACLGLALLQGSGQGGKPDQVIGALGYWCVVWVVGVGVWMGVGKLL